MRSSVGAALALALLFLSACGGKPPPPKELPAPPAIKSFVADKTKLLPGESAVLSFTAENATEAVLTDQAGTRIDLAGNASEGSATVTPASSSFYVLNVSGEGGRASAFVQVAVGEALKEVFLVPVPAEIESGEQVQLLWSAVHATGAVIKVGSGGELAVEEGAEGGVVNVSPARSETYELVADGAGGEQRASAQVAVRPVLASSDLQPAAAKVGEELVFTWSTQGAAEVSISEATFGLLHKTESAEDADQGTFTWIVPDQTAAQVEVKEGLPLEFTLLVKQANPDVTLTRVFHSFVGEGPRITTFAAPAAVTEDRTFELAWTTLNASRVQVYADGKLLFEPLPRDQASVTSGSITLQAPQADTVYRVVATGHGGTQVMKSQLVRVVPAPIIGEFNLPGSVAAAGDPAAASWKTQNATAITLRVKGGVAVHATEDAAQVADGSASVYPGTRTTFVLEAWNDAGDAARQEKVVDVSAPQTFTAAPSPVVPGGSVTINWAFDETNTAQVFGDLTRGALPNNPTTDLNFVDLALHTGAKALSFENADDAVAQVPVGAGFSFPLGGLTAGRFYVSTNGFVSFADEGALATNTPLDAATGTTPMMVAPFWDDLTLGDTGKVYALVEGTAFPRRLLIQWNEVETKKGDPATSLSFQLQLYETGEIRFIYLSLSGADSGGEGASIGWRLDGTLNDELSSPGTAVIASGDERIYFNSGAFSGTYTATPSASAVFTMVAKVAAGNYLVFPAPVNVIDPAAVIVNEAMVTPEMSATAGQWIELKNLTEADIDLSGAQLDSAPTATSFVLPEGTVLPAGGLLTLGQSADPLQNGGATVDVEWGSLTLDGAADGSITLSAGAAAVAAMSWTTGDLQPATSIQAPDTSMLTNPAGGMKCAPTSTFGGNGAKGTPGAENDGCFPYALSSIPVNYTDISTTGTALFAAGSSNQDSEEFDFDISSAPFTYFGQSKDLISVSSNGLFTFETIYAYTSTNGTKPDTTPLGEVAVFWDDLDNVTGGEGNAFIQRFAQDELAGEPRAHWIVQWHRFTHYTSTVANEDDLNFQAKLFDDGTIEFHYDVMISGTSSDYASGSSATVWISDPAATSSFAAALPIGINDAVIKPFTAYRFSPKP